MSIKKYREFAAGNENLPLFFQPWWLDAVAQNRWNVVLSEKGQEIHGIWVFIQTTKFGFPVIKSPSLTPYLGIWLNYPEGQKTTKRLSFEKKIINDLAGQLPNHSVLRQQMHYSFTNWLPLYWEGFEQTTRYTYLIEDISEPEAVWKGLQSRIRRAIKKATKRYNLEVYESDDLEEFYRLHCLTFIRQNKKPPHSFQLIKNIDDACKERNKRKILFAKDADGNHATVYIVYDKNSAYYLMGGADPEKRNSGATSVLMWEAIKRSSDRVRVFDFEGSMMPEIENFFSSFGGDQKRYFQIKNHKNLVFKIGEMLID